MSKKLIIVAGVLVLFLTACSSGGDESPTRQAQGERGTATAVGPTEVAPTSGSTAEGAQSSDSLRSAFTPIRLFTVPLLWDWDATLEPEDPSPALAALLLSESDLPTGYVSVMEAVGSTDDLPEGQVKSAASVYGPADWFSDDTSPFGTAAAFVVPSAVLDDFQSSLEALDGVSTGELEDALGVPGGIMGFDLTGVPDLGDGGLSLRVVARASEDSMLGEDNLDAAGKEAFREGAALEIYVFKRNEHLFMVLTVWPATESPPVDGLALAKAMDSHAQQAPPTPPAVAPSVPPVAPTAMPVPPTATPLSETQPLPPPQDLGPVRAGGKALVTISNDEPNKLIIEFTGPDSTTISLPPCPTCPKYNVPPASCPEEGFREVLRFTPGLYTVSVRADDPGIAPLAGTWDLHADTAYLGCWFSVDLRTSG